VEVAIREGTHVQEDINKSGVVGYVTERLSSLLPSLSGATIDCIRLEIIPETTSGVSSF